MRCLEAFLSDPTDVLFGMPARDKDLAEIAERLKSRAKTLSSIPAVKADAAWRWFWQTENSWIMEDDPDQFGRLRLPFPAMVIEGRNPRQVWVENEGWIQVTSLDTCVVVQELGADRGDGYTLAFDVMQMAPGGQVVIDPSVTFISINKEGQLTPFPDAKPESNPYLKHASPLVDDVDPSLRSTYLTNLIRPALLSIALMHCKNTNLIKEHVPEKVRAKRRKTGKPIVDWNVIQVPSPTSHKSQLTEKETGTKVPLHLVRGHFKTYTEEAPLFGSLTGTYWWSSHARGDLAAGQRHHKYEVRSGKHESK